MSFSNMFKMYLGFYFYTGMARPKKVQESISTEKTVGHSQSPRRGSCPTLQGHAGKRQVRQEAEDMRRSRARSLYHDFQRKERPTQDRQADLLVGMISLHAGV